MSKRFAFVSCGGPGSSILCVNEWKFVMDNFDLLNYLTENEFESLCSKLGEYEFIWFYFMPDPTFPNYQTYPKLMRAAAPNAKIVMQTDVGAQYFGKDKYAKQYKPYIDAFFDCIDWGSAEGEDKFDWDWKTFPLYYLDFPRPIAKWREQYTQPFEARDDFVALMSRSGSSAKKSIETVTDAGFRVKVFTGKANHSKLLEKWLQNCKNGSLFHNEMGQNEYLMELGKCKAAIDDSDGYNGMSRFVLDCAFLHIPVVGYAGLRIMRNIFPALATEKRHDPAQIQLIQKLMTDDAYRFEVAKRGYVRSEKQYSVEECTKRLKKIMKKVGVELD